MRSDSSVIKQEDGSIFQNGVKYAPSKEIAKEFDYALSYVAFLARKNKVNATWFGKRWYIDRDSVLKYRKSAKNNKILGGQKSQNNYAQPVLTPINSKYAFKKSDILRISSLLLLILIFMFGAGIIPISLNTELLQQDYTNFKTIISDRIIGNISLLFNDISNFFSSYANAANTQISRIPGLFFNHLLTVTQTGIDLTNAASARISRVPDLFYNYFLAFTQTGVDLNQATYNLVLEVKFNLLSLSGLPESVTSFYVNTLTNGASEYLGVLIRKGSLPPFEHYFSNLSAFSMSIFSYFNGVFSNIAFVFTNTAQSLIANIWESIYLPLLPR